MRRMRLTRIPHHMVLKRAQLSLWAGFGRSCVCPTRPSNGRRLRTCWSTRSPRPWTWVTYIRCCSKEFGARSLAKTSSSRRQNQRKRKHLPTMWYEWRRSPTEPIGEACWAAWLASERRNCSSCSEECKSIPISKAETWTCCVQLA